MGFYTVDDSEFQAWAKEVQAKVANPMFLKGELQQSLKRVGKKAQQNVIAATPVDTGYLHRNWNIDGPFISGTIVALEIYSNVGYAPYVENGHRTRGGGGWVPGKHMLMTMLFEMESQMPMLITPGLMRALEGLL